MAGQGLECGKIMEIFKFFLGKVPWRPIFGFSPVFPAQKGLDFRLKGAFGGRGLAIPPKETHHDRSVTGDSRSGETRSAAKPQTEWRRNERSR